MTRDELREWAEQEVAPRWTTDGHYKAVLRVLSRLEACERALKPFAEAADRLPSYAEDFVCVVPADRLTAGDLRSSRAALEDK